MPLNLRCECGAISREDIDPFRRLQSENARLEADLRAAREEAAGLRAAGNALAESVDEVMSDMLRGDLREATDRWRRAALAAAEPVPQEG